MSEWQPIETAPKDGTENVQEIGGKLLDIWERAFSGKHPELEQTLLEMSIAASFGSAAHEACPDLDAAPLAMMQSFLQALADPTDSRLDYLRAQPPQEGE